MTARGLALAVALAACTSPPAPPAPSVTQAAPAPAAPSAPARPPVVSASAPPEPPSAPPAPPPPRVDIATALFPDPASAPPGAAGCLGVADERDRAHCLLFTRFERDADAVRLATDLFDTTGDVAGVEVEHEMDGGFRGSIHIVPEVPVGRYRRHLAWVAASVRDFDAFFAALAAKGSVRYRVRPVAFRFFRSVGRATPSAYAGGWDVAYNVSGSLFVSADAVRETLFHEIFHLNDADHGDWSAKHLRGIFDAIVARCGTRLDCLRPYAPGDTTVKGGTYYAFQPDNGDTVHEYAAELATRWYQEQRAALRREREKRPQSALQSALHSALHGAPWPFKCGPEENRRAWDAIVSEFFGGADLVPACP